MRISRSVEVVIAAVRLYEVAFIVDDTRPPAADDLLERLEHAVAIDAATP